MLSSNTAPQTGSRYILLCCPLCVVSVFLLFIVVGLFLVFCFVWLCGFSVSLSLGLVFGLCFCVGLLFELVLDVMVR